MTARVRVKICGITSVIDAQTVVRAGADAIGLVFYEHSSRAVKVDTAIAIAKAVPALVSVVGLFVDASADYVEQICNSVPLDQLQFHGNESGAFCRQFGRRYIKAVPMNQLASATEISHYLADYQDASACLFDAYGGGTTGGSGQRFGWRELPENTPPMIIAGGLTAENIGEVICHYRPFAVDVSSGVESAPGVKSSVKISNFIQALT